MDACTDFFPRFGEIDEGQAPVRLRDGPVYKLNVMETIHGPTHRTFIKIQFPGQDGNGCLSLFFYFQERVTLRQADSVTA